MIERSARTFKKDFKGSTVDVLTVGAINHPLAERKRKALQNAYTPIHSQKKGEKKCHRHDRPFLYYIFILLFILIRNSCDLVMELTSDDTKYTPNGDSALSGTTKPRRSDGRLSLVCGHV